MSDEAVWKDAKRIMVAVDWVNAVGERVEPVELTGWSFAPEEESE